MSGDNPVWSSIATDRPDGSTSRTISGSLPDRLIRAASTAWTSIPARAGIRDRPVMMTPPS